MAVSTDVYESLKRRAISTVAKAIREGRILPASEFKCVDCGAQACDYDHRDYSRRLDVEPVCRRCNITRGLAVNAPSDIGRKGWLKQRHDGASRGDNEGYDNLFCCHAPIDFDLIDNHIEFLYMFDQDPVNDWCGFLPPKKYRSHV